MKKSKRTHILGRYGFMFIPILFLASAIVFMAVHTTVIHADDWNKKAYTELSRHETIYPVRGDILASDGSILATNLRYYSIYVDYRADRFMIKQYHESLDSLADSLAHYFPVRDKRGWKERLKAPVNIMPRSARPRYYRLLADISFDDVQRVKKFPFFRRSRKSGYTGLIVNGRVKRSYPFGSMACHSIGRVGEQRDSTIHGISGLEYALDSLLYGKPGSYKKVFFTSGLNNWTDVPAVDGSTITTTIDITMQDIVEHELSNMLATTSAEWGTALLMEVSTGDIKAISNLERDSTTGHYIEAMNRAVQGFEPGSVMKALSMTVALEDGFVRSLDQPLSIEQGGFRYAGGNAIKDTHSPSSITVGQVLEYSSNIGITKIIAPRYDNDPNGFRERLREMGFFDRFNTGIANEQRPLFRTLRNNRDGRITLSRMSFGYATLIPPLYMCAFYNALANDGRFVRPRLVKAVRGADGTDSVMPVTYVRDRICSEDNARRMRAMLREVVWGKHGTARGLKSDIVEIAGKTGTCKIANEIKRDRNGRILNPEVKPGYREGHYRLAFCGFFPYENPKYTCMVLISDPSPAYRGAGSTSGMVLKNIALKMFSRGLLDNASDYRENAPDKPLEPTFYASAAEGRSSTLAKGLGAESRRHIASPRKDTPAGTVPDVCGLGLREAVVRLESAGYAVKFRGQGYVASQTPVAATRARSGSAVTLTLK